MQRSASGCEPAPAGGLVHDGVTRVHDGVARVHDGVARVLDVVLASVALVVTAPVVGVVALLVRHELGRPVLFRQLRAGRDGVPFVLVKFRSMRERTGAVDHDDDRERLTPFGAKLRASSLDELPTLWNVLRGDMSLVGPRPLHVYYMPLYTPRQARRLEVRPGITGLAQVSGRNALNWEERLELDVRYVETRSLALDLRVLARTVAVVLRRSGIAPEGEVTMTTFTGGAHG
ncbi:lipopolysaccharide/colanic/teichoic acid biosynthesis glycosyltransferase [Georgenia soli]|uniref:Lipopolysaccharide/colanic/teichoic acid biosynthesis glycosyltransferase n=1 Tax=Georgenia soli TaxID=638953 RepID=A0A2A9EJI3_9MICO|nr:sugar transferase [Georgenia soli]PFG39104.1 lipopolysaccharide/colanic/teichoic acid biosynthesis glycosyltransferase [Georgenia soli]